MTINLNVIQVGKKLTVLFLREITIQLMKGLSDKEANSLNLRELKGGINSAVYCVEVHKKPIAVLKKYRDDPYRNRQASEANFLNFLELAMPEHSPRLLASLPSENISLIEWIEGKHNPMINEDIVNQFIDFQLTLDKFKSHQIAKIIGPAADAVLCPSMIIKQLNNRFERLSHLELHQEVTQFLNTKIKPYMSKSISQTLEAYERMNIDPEMPINKRFQTLIPSDFGTHNSIYCPNGKLVFIDFEFAGWDDPLTSIANFMIHPGINANMTTREPFKTKMFQYFKNVPLIKERYSNLINLFGLRWCLIMLNIFIKTQSEDKSKMNYSEAMQLKKSKLMFHSLFE